VLNLLEVLGGAVLVFALAPLFALAGGSLAMSGAGMGTAKPDRFLFVFGACAFMISPVFSLCGGWVLHDYWGLIWRYIQ
jgi:hypothetical protein